MTTSKWSQKSLAPFIAGELASSSSGESFTSINPATEEVLADVALADHEVIERAVQAARDAFDYGPWPRLPARARRDYLAAVADAVAENAEVLATLESLDTGLPIVFTRAHMSRVEEHFRYFAAEALRIDGTSYPHDGAYLHVTTREPMGVVALITPWNAPLGIASMGVAAALACGNTCVLKPSELSPITAGELAKIIQALELPPGVLNVVYGPGRPTGEALVAHPGVDAIGFTGRSETGQELMRSAASSFKRVVAELGGCASTLLFADGDIERAVDGTLMCAFANNGEACIAGAHLMVERPVFSRVVDRMAGHIDRIVLGDPIAPQTQVGPVISSQSLERLCNLVDEGIAEGMTLHCGGRRSTAFARGFYFEPAIMTSTDGNPSLLRREIFGPLVTVCPFDSEDEAVTRANDTIYGLANYVWSENLQRALRVATRLRSGTVWCNSPMIRNIRAPFGGFKASGVGRIGGRYSIDAFTEVKNTCIPVQPYHSSFFSKARED